MAKRFDSFIFFMSLYVFMMFVFLNISMQFSSMLNLFWATVGMKYPVVFPLFIPRTRRRFISLMCPSVFAMSIGSVIM